MIEAMINGLNELRKSRLYRRGVPAGKVLMMMWVVAIVVIGPNNPPSPVGVNNHRPRSRDESSSGVSVVGSHCRLSAATP